MLGLIYEIEHGFWNGKAESIIQGIIIRGIAREAYFLLLRHFEWADDDFEDSWIEKVANNSDIENLFGWQTIDQMQDDKWDFKNWFKKYNNPKDIFNVWEDNSSVY